jgi:CheY-like chemotaxis protein
MQKKKLIICIDDEKMVLDSLKSQLKKHFPDYAFEFAESADEGLEVIQDMVDEGLDILIVVSDWLMPGMKGDEFLINVHKKFPQIVKVLLTGQADSDAIERAKNQANLHKCLAKPWDEKELIDALKSGLAKLN